MRGLTIANQDVAEFGSTTIVVGTGVVEKYRDSQVICSRNEKNEVLRVNKIYLFQK